MRQVITEPLVLQVVFWVSDERGNLIEKRPMDPIAVPLDPAAVHQVVCRLLEIRDQLQGSLPPDIPISAYATGRALVPHGVQEDGYEPVESHDPAE
jgi:hypothetical protein